jgi:hypothetical protein
MFLRRHWFLFTEDTEWYQTLPRLVPLCHQNCINCTNADVRLEFLMMGRKTARNMQSCNSNKVETWCICWFYSQGINFNYFPSPRKSTENCLFEFAIVFLGMFIVFLYNWKHNFMWWILELKVSNLLYVKFLLYFKFAEQANHHRFVQWKFKLAEF